MMKTCAALAFVGVAGAAVLAGSSSAQMTVTVTVVQSCAVDTRSQLRLTCTAGAQSNLRVAETTYAPSPTATSAGSTVLTLNF